jgi:hypothetical protein
MMYSPGGIELSNFVRCLLLLLCGLLVMPEGFCVCQCTITECEEHHQEHDGDCPAQENTEVHKIVASGTHGLDQLVDFDQASLKVHFLSHSVDRHTPASISFVTVRPDDPLFLRHCALLI